MVAKFEVERFNCSEKVDKNSFPIDLSIESSSTIAYDHELKVVEA